MQLAMIQDKIIPIEQLEPVYLDRGTFFGDGVYEVIRSYNGRIFALDEHLERLERSLAEIRITGVDIEQIRKRILQAFEMAAQGDAKIYFHVTRGSGTRDHCGLAGLKPNFFLTISPLSDCSREKNNGIALSTHPDWRWKRCDIKSLNLLPNVLARMDAQKKGCDEAIFVNEKGLITEGAASAFFVCFGQVLRTSPLTENILPSITRKYTLKAAKEIGMQVAEKAVAIHEVKSCTEMFIAVTTKDIVGAVKFDGQIVADGKIGKYTRLLMEKFAAYV